MNKNRALITGTGRAGTTMIVEILTEIGEDTKPELLVYTPRAQAGLEWTNPEHPESPYWCKSPAFCEMLPHIIERGEVVIDVVFVCWRPIAAAAESRRIVQGDQLTPRNGGTFGDPRQMENTLRLLLEKLFSAVAPTQIPVVFIDFETAKADAGYLFQKLTRYITAPRAEFDRAHSRIVKL